MELIILLIAFILVLRLILNSYKYNPQKRHKLETKFCLFSYIAIVLLAAFRGELVGADTLGYIYDYTNVKTMSYTEIAERYEGYVGYYYLSKLFSASEMPIYIWFGFIELMLVLAISRFINKYSTDRLYSIVLFIVTGLFMFSLAGLKQTLAMSLITHGYLDFSRKRIWLGFAWSVGAFFVHPVSLIMLIAFALSYIKKKEIFTISVIVILVVFIAGTMSSFSFLVSLLGNEHYEMYLEKNESYTMSTLYLYVLIVLCTLPYVYKYLRNKIEAKIEFACVLILCTFQYTASLSPNLFRLALVFIPFLIVYVPNTFDNSNKEKYSLILKLVAIIGPIIFFIYSTRNTIYYTI